MVIYFLCMVFSGIACGQNEQERMEHRNVDEIKVVPPKFTGISNAVPALRDGNLESIQDYLARNVAYPEKDVKEFNQGTEVVRFVVSPTGELSDFMVINSVSQKIDEEVIRVLETTKGMWIPGQNNGEPVAMEREVSVKFQLTGIPHPLDFKAQGTKYYTKASDLLVNRNNPKKALKFYDRGIRYLPNEEGLLLMRGLARYELGDKDGAYSDWSRIKGAEAELNEE